MYNARLVNILRKTDGVIKSSTVLFIAAFILMCLVIITRRLQLYRTITQNEQAIKNRKIVGSIAVFNGKSKFIRFRNTNAINTNV
jgi:hypothetical protein